MDSWQLVAAGAISLTTAALVVGCSAGSSQFCAESATPGGPPVRCVQIAGLGGSTADLAASTVMNALCTAMGQTAANGDCPADGRVGGCQEESEGYVVTEWEYEGTIDDIECDTDESKLDGDGTVLEAPAGDDDTAGDDDDATDDICSLNGGVSITVTFSNDSGQQVTLYWVDWDCNEVAYHLVDAGGTVDDQQTFGLHGWRARAGDSAPSGAVVWERRLVDTDDGATISIQ